MLRQLRKMTPHKKDISDAVHNSSRNISSGDSLEGWMIEPSDITEFEKWITERLRFISVESSSKLLVVSDILSHAAALYKIQKKRMTNELWNFETYLEK